ncbi:MAG: hypothetical protein CSA64_04365 [Arachnia propionica]|nr:MAG: hypothetical protein CSA64_04365 [Arachnia propionica]
MRLVRALAALATLALLVVGVPVLLLALGNPQDLLVLEWPSALLRPDDGRALLALLSVVGWLAWALLLATIAAELVTELTRGQVKLRLPGTGWLRPLVVPLVAAMLAPLLTLLAQDTPAAALAQPAATQPASAAVMTPTEAEEEAEPAGEVQDAAEQVRVHVVGPEDDLWTLAEQYLGSGPRWREISRVNPELDPLAALPVGYELRLPAGAVLPEQAAAANPGPESVPTAAVETRATAAPIGAPAASDTPVATGPLPTAPTSNLPGAAIEQEPASPADSDAEAAPGPATGEAESPRTVVVQRGDTLWDLAAEHLGDPELWPKIAAANQDIIEDPDLIDIGWVLTIPDLPQPEAAAAAEEPAAAPAVPAETQPVSEPGLPLLPGERPADAAADSADLAPASEGISLLNPPASALPPAPIPDNGDTDVPRNAEVAATQATAQPGRNETPAELTASRTSPPPSADPETAVTSATPASPGDASGRLLGPIGAVLAASIFVGIGARRRAQLLQRAVGRRIIPVRPQLQRFWASLAATADHSGKPRRFAPTSLVVGWNAKADVVVNLEQARLLPVAAPADLAAGFAAAAITGLTCASWSDTVEVIAVTPDERWDTAIDDPRLRVSDTTEVAIAELAERCTERQRELGKTNLASARGDADTRDAFAPVVFVWCRPVARPDFDRIQATLTAAEVGVSAVVPVECLPQPGNLAPNQLPGGALRRCPTTSPCCPLPSRPRSAVQPAPATAQ